MKSTPSGDSPSAPAPLGGPILDAKVYIEHDPTIGYHYTPNFRRTLIRPGGGEYTLVTNSIGIRSEREYAKPKPPGVFRIIVLGDSFAAGQYVSNDQRFTELLERRLGPGVEVMNFALEGTGTDQQLLIFETAAREYEPDLVIIFPFLQNIRRNMADARLSYDPATMKPILLAKPRFELMPDGRLELRNVPVPTERKAADEPGATNTDIDRSLKHRIKVKLSSWRAVAIAKRFVYGLKPWEPFPEYKSPDTPGWRLMEAILRRLHDAANGKPVVIVPVFYGSYVQYRMARNYWDRFNSLTATPGIHAIDLLPDFKRLGREATACFQEPYDPHYSARGHLVVADALERELRARQLLR
jgi:hypothetical protein